MINAEEKKVSLSKLPPLPISCRLCRDLRLFRVTRCVGRDLALGGFGVPISIKDITSNDIVQQDSDMHQENSLETLPRSNNDGESNDDPDPVKSDLHGLDDNGEEADRNEPDRLTADHLFIEEVIFLHERGLLEAFNDHGTRLLSDGIYGLLDTCGLSLAAYLVYAHLRAQTFRVVRHTPNRRKLVEEINQMFCDSNESSRRTFARSSSRHKKLRRRIREDAANAAPPGLYGHCKEKPEDQNDCIAFDAYNPESSFSRSIPGLPDFYVAATYYAEPLLPFGEIQRLIVDVCQGVPLKLATVSDSGTVIMFGVTDYGAPTIVRPVRKERQTGHADAGDDGELKDNNPLKDDS